MSLRRWVVVAGIVVAAIAAAGLWYLFLRPGGPAPVALATGTPPPDDTGAVATLAPATSGPGATASVGIDGTWSIDGSAGGFVGYRVREQLANIGANTAVGRTTAVSGSMTITGTSVSDARISADLTQLQSDDQRRDGQLRDRGLETSRFPTATFELGQPIDLRSVPADGQTIDLTATGDLTLHGVTKAVEIPLEARLDGVTIEVVGSIEINFADYSITPPTSFIALSVEDHGTMELHLYFAKS